MRPAQVKGEPKSLVAPLALSRGLTQHCASHGGRDRNAPIWSWSTTARKRASRCASPPAARPRPAAASKCSGIVEPQDFVQFGGVQAAIEEEQRLRIEGVVSAAIGEILDEVRGRGEHHRPPGRGGEDACANIVGGRDEIAALVLGAAPSGQPGPVGRQFHRQRCRAAAVPGDDHPRLPQRRAAGAAELKNRCEDLAEPDAAGLVLLA